MIAPAITVSVDEANTIQRAEGYAIVMVRFSFPYFSFNRANSAFLKAILAFASLP